MAAPRTLGKYEILDLLGVGGMGTVYRARDMVLERIVAVKLLHQEHQALPGSGHGGTRFLNEARAVARLNHPTIVSVYDFSDTDPAGAFFAMEYVDGCTIEDYVGAWTDARLAHVLHLMRQLLDGLAYAHAQGVVHRDIKPSNLLVTQDSRLKITDFGIAKIGSLKQTMTGMMIGTPAYMAPERYISGDIDQRCDVYSAGVVLFELLTGRRPFNGALTQVMYQICHVVPSPVSSVEPSIPSVLDPVLAKALAKDPDARFQTAGEFAAALAVVREALELGTQPGATGSVATPASTGHAVPSPGAGALDTLQMSNLIQPREASAVTPDPAEADAAAPLGWSSVQLAEIERQLTPIVGPMARIVVKRAAALTRDRGRLCEDLAGQLRTDEERRRFLHGMSLVARNEDAMIPAQSPPTPFPSAIAPATLDRATQVLMRYIGPIGAVLVKRTAPTALDESDLYARLAQRITDVQERARFLAELTRPI